MIKLITSITIYLSLWWGGLMFYNNVNDEGLILKNEGYYVFDHKQGDVNGDNIIDNVYLVGKRPFGLSSGFNDNIQLVIQDGSNNKFYYINFKDDAGYNPTIFLGDFTGNKIEDILISIDSGGSGGFQYHYIYSFVNNNPIKIFDHEEFNKEYTYDVTYKNNYLVDVFSKKLNKIFTINLFYKGQDYLSEIYDNKGTLKKSIEGFANPISALYPVDVNRDGIYELLAYQRLAGQYNADGLGYVQTILKWNGDKFDLYNQYVAVFGKDL